MRSIFCIIDFDLRDFSPKDLRGTLNQTFRKRSIFRKDDFLKESILKTIKTLGALGFFYDR